MTSIRTPLSSTALISPLIALAAGELLHVALSSVRVTFSGVLPVWLSFTIGVLDSSVVAALVLLVAWLVVQFSRSKDAPDVEQFARWLRWCTVACIAVLAFPSFRVDGIAWVIVENVVVGVLIAGSAWAAFVLLRVVRSYRTARTAVVLRSLGLVMLATIPLRLLEEYVAPGSLEVVYVFQGMVVCVLVVLLARRRRWLNDYTRAHRWGIVWWCCCVAILSIIVATQLFDSSSMQSSTLRQWLIGTELLVGYVYLALATYTSVALATVVSSGSSAARKTFEFDAITFFNRVVSEHAQPQQLYDTTVSLAVALTDATSAVLILHESEQWEIVATAGLDIQRAAALELHAAWGGTMPDEPVVVPYLQEDEHFYRIARSVESYAQSLMFIPLREGSVCYGGLVVVSNVPFAFEQSDVSSLAAFAPAVTIALANQKLLYTAIERERLHRELMLGKEIQQKLLPTAIPPLNGWDVAGWSEPAMEVGGDYFDYFVLGDGTACVVVADVSGKGISAAFYMAKLKGICLALAPLCRSVQDFVLRIHRVLDGGVLEPRVYITLVAVGIAPAGSIHVMRAGHPPPLGVTTDGQVQVIAPSGIALGMVETERFAMLTQLQILEYQQLSTLILFSDGLLEIGLPHANELGLEGIQRIVQRVHANNCTAEQLMHNIRANLDAMYGATSYHDDMTMVIMKRPTTQD